MVWVLAIVGAVALVALVALSRANELFAVSVRNGRVMLVRGAIPPQLMDAIADVMRRANVRRAMVRAVKTDTHARIVVSGADDAIAQRLRNVFGTHHWSKLRSQAPKPTARNVGQVVGVAWLAWLLARRS